jgi:hypothetical protein
MSVRLKTIRDRDDISKGLRTVPDVYRCELCYHWSPTEESDSFVVIRFGIERKVIHGTCILKTSEPDSECLCPCFERDEKTVTLDDDVVKLFRKMTEDGQEALIHFKTTGDRSKFKEWTEKYKDIHLGGER